MRVATERIELKTTGDCQMIDITPMISQKLGNTALSAGTVTIFCPGATGGVTTIEFEPGLVKDIPEFFDRIIPEGNYHHDQTWHDGNGHSHLRASLLGPSLTVPFESGNLTLGTWQQVVFIDFDNKPHARKLVLQFIGE